MVRSRRSISKEDASSVLADSGISLSSPSGASLQPEEEEEIIEKLCVSDDGGGDDDEEDDIKNDNTSIDPKEKEVEEIEEREDEEKEMKKVLNAKHAIEMDDHGANTDTKDAVIAIASNYSNGSERKPLSCTSPNSSAAKRRRTTSVIKEISTTTSTVSPKAKTKAVHAAVKSAKPTKTTKKGQRKSYECDVCHKQFGGNTDLRRHLLIHTDERPYQCTICGKSYRQLVNLKNHTKSVHDTQRQFRCKLCPKSFALKERLRLHMRVHSGEKPYACQQCGKKFARGGQLQQHLVTHDGGADVKSVHCSQCSAAFSSAANLRLHMRRHEEGPNFLCHICNELFLNEVMLRAHVNTKHFKLKQFDCDICKETIKDDDPVAHMKTHSNAKTHICEVCNSLFTQKSQYNVHMRMHTGERPYQCRICWQSFAHSSVLKLHIRKHTGEKPFKCLLCKNDVAFSQLAHLKTHMKKIHKKENPYMCEGCQEFFKVKIDLQAHLESSTQCAAITNERLRTDGNSAGSGASNINGGSGGIGNGNDSLSSEAAQLSHLRFMIALLLKKISSEQKLNQLGYEKRLIDNVIIASLKLGSRKFYDDHKMSEIDRLRLNVQEFLEWIVPAQLMDTFKQEQLTVEKILDKIVTMYMKHK